jgi:hypothetical protein
MRVFNVLLDGTVKHGHDNGGRFRAATAVFRLNATRLLDPGLRAYALT